MEAAIFGLIGVIVGGIITAGSTYLLDRRRERTERERDKRNHALEVKRAARSIDSELSWARAAAHSWADQKRWTSPVVPLLSLSTEARQKYVDTIAPDLSDEAWLSVTFALQAVETIRVILAMPRDLAIAIPEDVAESFVPLITSIDEGRRGLAPYHLDFHATGKSTQ